MRSAADIATRIGEVQYDDFLGFRRDVLLQSLPYEQARPWLLDSTTEAAWNEIALLTDTAVLGRLHEYLVIAQEKALDHRGISANRSVDKIGEYLWLLEEDAILAAFREAPYPQYGVPQLAVAFDRLSVPQPTDPAWARMRHGQPCTETCDMGCSR